LPKLKKIENICEKLIFESENGFKKKEAEEITSVVYFDYCF